MEINKKVSLKLNSVVLVRKRTIPTLYQLKLALTSPTGCGRSVGIVKKSVTVKPLLKSYKNNTFIYR
jgi:hypothetical protein